MQVLVKFYNVEFISSGLETGVLQLQFAYYLLSLQTMSKTENEYQLDPFCAYTVSSRYKQLVHYSVLK